MTPTFDPEYTEFVKSEITRNKELMNDATLSAKERKHHKSEALRWQQQLFVIDGLRSIDENSIIL